MGFVVFGERSGVLPVRDAVELVVGFLVVLVDVDRSAFVTGVDVDSDVLVNSDLGRVVAVSPFETNLR